MIILLHFKHTLPVLLAIYNVQKNKREKTDKLFSPLYAYEIKNLTTIGCALSYSGDKHMHYARRPNPAAIATTRQDQL